MTTLKYTIIKNEKQYLLYCDALEELVLSEDKANTDEIELLTLLIEKWDEENNSLEDLNPIELLQGLMNENNLKAKDLVDILGVSKSTVSKMLNYQKGLSKETIRKLATYFKFSQESFNRPYQLDNEVNQRFENASLMNTRKNILQHA